MKEKFKKAWHALPSGLREWPLKVLCLLRMGPRRHVQARVDGPMYIIGNFQAGGGLSRSAELYAQQLCATAPHCLCVDVSREMLQSVKKPQEEGAFRRLAEVRGEEGEGTVIIHLNPPQFLWLLCKLGRKFFKRKHMLAYWAWELEDIPSLWKFALRFVDAVEVPSTFTREAIAKNTEKPVRVHPHAVPQPSAVKQAYCQGGMLRCLLVFDMGSGMARKNPQAAVAAFVRAFGPREAELTIKIIQPKAHASDWEELQVLVAQHPHIRLVSEWMEEAALERLFLEHDVYLSLHRSEGYGLTLREALLRGLYVVATGWSGNMEFMEGERAFAVPYTLVPLNGVDKRWGKLPHARWAEPDIAKAAEMLQGIRLKLMALAGKKASTDEKTSADKKASTGDKNGMPAE